MSSLVQVSFRKGTRTASMTLWRMPLHESVSEMLI